MAKLRSGLASLTTKKASSFGYGGIEKQGQRLPMYKYRNSILYLVETHAVTTIVGETGSGKTTQIPQYLREADWAGSGYVITCTQPRRLAVQSIWISLRGAQKEQDEAKMKFAAAEGDHVTFLNVYKGFVQSGNLRSGKNVVEVREQLKRIMQRLGIPIKLCERDMRTYSHDGKYKTIRSSQDVYIHRSSILFRVNLKWVIYHSLVSTERQYMRNAISIYPSWLIEASPHFYQRRGLESMTF
ncbi:putative pre-mRNA-splicing factor ATP-dependent RNA helicase DEAH9 [Drosera capensis]